MKRLFFLLKDFVKQDFHLQTYLLIILWATILLSLNFTIDLENEIIDNLPTNGLRFLGYFLLYSTAYYSTVYITLLRIPKEERNKKMSTQFWKVSLAGIAIFSADSGFVLHQYIVDAINPSGKTYNYFFAVLSNATEFITIALPLFVVNYFWIPNRSDNLGINKKEIELKPFFLVLIIITPFIFISAFEAGLNNYYPTFHYTNAAKALALPDWIPVSIYELFYGLDFFNVELMFRGFMVVGMISILGRHVLLPMAVLYCCIHFGKPVVEAISSLFGGYILGAIAFQTRAIWGGVIVHMGLSWLMELSAFCVKEMLKD